MRVIIISEEQSISINYFKKIIDEYIEFYSQRNNVTKGYSFALWYFQIIKGFTEEDAIDSITDGPGDANIDAIYVDKGNKSLNFYQFKNHKLNNSYSLGEVDSFLSGINSIKEFIVYEKIDKKRVNGKLLKKLSEIIYLSENREITKTNVYLISASNTNLSQDANLRIENFMKDWFRTSAVIECQFLNISDLISSYQKLSYNDTIDEVKIKLIEPIVFNFSDDKVRILNAITDGKQLAEIYNLHKEFLLMKNVRVGLDLTEVNQSIYHTATSSESNKFLFFNNGITIIVDKFLGIFGNCTLINPQIVNGGQTVRILAKALNENTLKNDVKVNLRIIETNNIELTTEITKNLNNQNMVSKFDKLSSNAYSLLLKTSLEARGYYLERRINEFQHFSESQKQIIATRLKRDIVKMDEYIIPLHLILIFNNALTTNKGYYPSNLSSFDLSIENEEISENEILDMLFKTSPDNFIKLNTFYQEFKKFTSNFVSILSEKLNYKEIQSKFNPRLSEILNFLIESFNNPINIQNKIIINKENYKYYIRIFIDWQDDSNFNDSATGIIYYYFNRKKLDILWDWDFFYNILTDTHKYYNILLKLKKEDMDKNKSKEGFNLPYFDEYYLGSLLKILLFKQGSYEIG